MKIGIIGASGYTGAELIRLLANHNKAEVTVVTSNKYAGKKVSELYPNLDTGLKFESYSDEVFDKADFFFTALPHTRSMEIVPRVYKAGKKVVDLSADFRLEPLEFEKFYGMVHIAPELHEQSVYGLPELYSEDIIKAKIVANPGCYPTAIILALAPALKQKLIKYITVSAITGVSGSGKNPDDKSHFNFANESVWAYKVAGTHQHLGEIESQLSLLAQSEQNVTFTPQLGPFSRGIYCVCTAKLIGKELNLTKLYKQFYKEAPFIKILDEAPVLKAVTGSNDCQIYTGVDGHTNKIVAISAIDNLVKGASGQAIQNMNLMLGFEETQGLEVKGLYP